MKKFYDYIIIGAGPAGLQLGHHFQKNALDYLIFESGESVGSSFKKFPRHGTLISINKVHTGYDDAEINLRWDWNSILCDDEDFTFKNYSKSYFPDAKDLVKYLIDYAEKFNINVATKQKVETVDKTDLGTNEERFVITTADGNHIECGKLIIATGFSQPYLPNIPGIELAENYINTSVNKEEFANKRVLVLGKGNSGFETADHLTETAALIHVCSPTSVKFAWQTHYVGNLRAINNNFLDTYQLKSQNALLDADVVNIKKENGKYQVSLKYAHASGEEEVIEYDHVIVCAGFKLDKSIFAPDCMPETKIDDKLPALNESWESENISQLYFAGTLMQGNFYKKTTSGFIHGFRYNVQTLFHILQSKYHQQELPHVSLAPNGMALADQILERINKSSALWQQFGYLIDIVEVHEDETKYFTELPKDYTSEMNSDRIFTISLEFGESQSNVFEINRNPTSEKADESFFLHPVIRHYNEGVLVSSLHLVEDLFGEWKHEEKHIKVLREYIAKEMEAFDLQPLDSAVS